MMLSIIKVVLIVLVFSMYVSSDSKDSNKVESITSDDGDSLNNGVTMTMLYEAIIQINSSINTRIDGLSDSIDSINTRIDGLSDSIDTRIDSLTTRLVQGFNNLHNSGADSYKILSSAT